MGLIAGFSDALHPYSSLTSFPFTGASEDSRRCLCPGRHAGWDRIVPSRSTWNAIDAGRLGVSGVLFVGAARSRQRLYFVRLESLVESPEGGMQQ